MGRAKTMESAIRTFGWGTGTALAGLVALTLAAAPADARRGSVTEKASLAPTGVDDDADGRTRLKVRGGSSGRFDVTVRRLDGDEVYELMLDGVRVGEITTNSRGRGRIRFRSRPRSDRHELLGFDPRGALISVRAATGEDILAVRLAEKPVMDGDVICCLPDDSGPECEDRTPAECIAQGGTVSAALSCLPNPCEGTPTPPGDDDVICCLPDDSGPECEDRTPAECSAQGGVVVEATSCLPNPCGSVAPPPPTADIQCCLPDDSGPECEDRTPAECAVEGGVNVGEGVCSPTSCAAVPPPPGGEVVRVRCERRSDRSKVSVDGNNFATGSYLAAITSGPNMATASARPTIGDQVEFDFDSDGGDIAAGATPIVPGFIEGTPPTVTGAILTLSGSVIAEATAQCEQR